MQHSQGTALSPSFPSFGRHRSDFEHHKFRVDLTLPTPFPPPAWASLPSPPMSGSPPPEHPPSPHQIAGRRRKRSESPPAVSTGASSLPTSLQQGPTSYGSYPPREPPAYASAQRTGGLSPYAPPPQQSQPMAYAVGPAVPAPLPSPSTQHFPGGPVSPRTTRKNKAHVASACINCKKKHLRCDNARPCRRCVQSGKEDTCEDVVHKKRGRPPLRPEDPTSRRSFDAGLLGDAGRRMPTTDPASYAQSGQYARSFRPLQAQPSYDPARSQYPPGQHYGLYAAPSVGPSSATAMGQFISTRGYGQGVGGQQTSAWPPAGGPSTRPLAPAPYQPNYGYSSDLMRPPQSAGYPTALFPRTQLPPPPNEPQGPGGVSSSLQLPPIRSSADRPPIDPSLASSGGSQANEYNDPTRGGTGTTRQPNPKRPKMDIQGILGPKHD